MVLDEYTVACPPLQLHSIDIHSSDTIIPDRKQLLTNEHKALCYSLAYTDNTEYFCYTSAANQIIHYANHGESISRYTSSRCIMVIILLINHNITLVVVHWLPVIVLVTTDNSTGNY